MNIQQSNMSFMQRDAFNRTEESTSLNFTGTDGCLIPYYGGIVTVFLNVISSPFGTVGNIFVWLAVFKNSKLRTVNNFFLLNLGLADLLVTIAAQPLFAKRVIETMENICKDSSSQAYRIASYISCMASILNLLCVTIDRTITLSKPFTFYAIMTRFRAFSMMIAVWVITFTYMVFSYFFKETLVWVTVTGTFFGMTFTSLVVLNIFMFTISKKFIKRRYKDNQSLDIMSREVQAHKKERKAAFTVTIILIVFAISWFPHLISLFVATSKGRLLQRFIGYITFTFGLMNSSVNPVLYCLRSREFRLTFKSIILRRNLETRGLRSGSNLTTSSLSLDKGIKTPRLHRVEMKGNAVPVSNKV